MSATSASASPSSAVLTADDDAQRLKMAVLRIGAQTDRGQLLFRQDAYAPLDKYNEGAEAEARLAIRQLRDANQTRAPTPEDVEGTWELVYCTKQLFRSSPFFMAIREAFGDATWHAPWDTEESAVPSGELFFRLHELQVKSWGTSTVGKVIQTIDVNKGVFISSFDTILFALTVIPIVGWFKLLPTFGARVVTETRDVVATTDDSLNTLKIAMEVEKTTVNREDGLPEPPFGLGALMGVEWPVNSVWKLLPWNGGRAPTCSTTVVYCDEDFRVNEDVDGELFVYMRCPDGTPALSEAADPVA